MQPVLRKNNWTICSYEMFLTIFAAALKSRWWPSSIGILFMTASSQVLKQNEPRKTRFKILAETSEISVTWLIERVEELLKGEWWS